uniref:CARD domain-containing protein n=1 Tax=Strongyloides papillosus TaxID=174720 RepID=A0A0N5B2M5_STREA
MFDTRVINKLISTTSFNTQKSILDELLQTGSVSLEELSKINDEKLYKMSYSKTAVENILNILQNYIKYRSVNPLQINPPTPAEVDNTYCNPKSIFALEHEDQNSTIEKHKKIIKDYLTGKRDKLTPKLASTILYEPKITDYDVVKANKEREILQHLSEERDDMYRRLARLNMERDKLRKIYHEKSKACTEINTIVKELFNEIYSDSFFNHPSIKSEIKKLVSELEPYYNNH